VRRLVAGSVTGLGKHWRLAGALLALQLAVAAVFGWVVYMSFQRVLGARPLFGRGVEGDLAALALALRGHADLLAPIAFLGIAFAALWGLASFYLAAGLIGRMRGQPFGEACARRGFAFFRLWLWALVPFGITIAAAFQGAWAMVGQVGGELAAPSHLGTVVLGAIPGALGYAFVATAVDLARVLLVDDPRLGAGRAFARGLARALGWPFLHYAGYALLWWGVGVGYLVLTFPLALGAGVLFLLRQLVVTARWLLRFATTAGQVAWIEPLQGQVLERGEVVEGPEARLDLGGAEAPHPVEPDVLDAK
jgi:hypothetical protein